MTADPAAEITTATCRVIGAGDGSVMVYCKACREPLPRLSQRGTLSDVLELWAEHTEAMHPGEVAQ